MIPTYGFSRQTLALAALHLPRPHAEPLSEGAIAALFGAGDEARKNLAWAWLEEGRRRMRGLEDATENTQRMEIPIEVSLRRRLQWNEPALDKLPEVCRVRRISSDASLKIISLCAGIQATGVPSGPRTAFQPASGGPARVSSGRRSLLARTGRLTRRTRFAICMRRVSLTTLWPL